MTCKSVERFKQGARMCQTTEKQTDRQAAAKCGDIGEIACVKVSSDSAQNL